MYNADSDYFSLVKDFFHKAFRPSTYDCNLCGITYSFKDLGMKKDWKNFIRALNISSVFLHRDEFKEDYGVEDAKFPCAYVKNEEDLKLFISQEEMNKLENLQELKDLILEKGEKLGIALQD